MNMKRILYILAVAFSCMALSVSCQTKEEPGTDISGVWHLVDTEGLILDQELDVDMYAVFNSGNFELYQRVGESAGRYWYYSGTYSTSGNVLTGRYSDGTRLGGVSGEGYSISLDGSTLFLTSVFSGEVSEYELVEEVPSEIADSAVPPVKSADAPAPVL